MSTCALPADGPATRVSNHRCCNSTARLFLLLAIGLFVAAFGATPMVRAQSKKELRRKIAELTQRIEEESSKTVIERNEAFLELASLRHDAATQVLITLLEKPKENVVAKQMIIRALGGERATRAGTSYALTKGFEILDPRNYHIISASFAGITDEEAIDWIYDSGWKTVPSLKAPAQLAFMKVFAATDPDRAVAGAKKLVGKRQLKTDTQIELVKVLKRAGDKSSAKKIRKLYKWDDAELMVAVLDYISSLKLTDDSDLVLKGVSSHYWQVRAIACDILGKTRDPSMLEYLLPRIEDRHLSVQLAAIVAVRSIGGEGVIEPLYKALDKAEGRAKDDIVDALIYLTGKNLGAQSLSWESWWGANKGKVKIEGVSREEYEKLIAEGGSGSSGMYYGLRVLSKNLAFIIDVSGSMQEPHKIPDLSGHGSGDKEKKKGSTGVAEKPSDEEKKKKKWIEKPKIDLAKRELRGVLGALSKGTQFNIIEFSGIPSAWKGELVGMDDETLEHALAYVDRLSPGGTTNVYDSLVLALNDPHVDTIYFLSDGAPTAGSYQNPKEIVEKIGELNALRKVKIHTIGFKLDPTAKKLMRKLAEENHGAFVDI